MSTSDSSSIRVNLDRLRNISVVHGAYDLDPRVVSGWVDMCLGALDVLVKAKRGKHSDDKALEQTVETHLEHARDHMDQATEASFVDNASGGYGLTGLDDDGLMHHDHATARVALLYARKAIVENEKRSRLARDKIREIKERLNTEREKRADKMEGVFWREIQKSILGDSVTKPRVVIGLDGADTYPVETVSKRKRAEELFGKNSGLAELFKGNPVYQVIGCDRTCKVDKVEHGLRLGRVTCPITGEPIFTYLYNGSVISHSPTRKLETENKPGKTSASCNGTAINSWTVSVNGQEKFRVLRDNSGNATWSPAIPLHVSAPHAWQLSGQCHGCVFAKYSGGPGYDTVRCDGCKDKWNRPGYEAKQ